MRRCQQPPRPRSSDIAVFVLVCPVRSVHALNECTSTMPPCPTNFTCCQDPGGTFAVAAPERVTKRRCHDNGTCCLGPDGTINACCSGTTPNCDQGRGQCVGFSKPPKGGSCKQPGSIIGCETQTLGQVISITGTPFTLYYQSDMVFAVVSVSEDGAFRLDGRGDLEALRTKLGAARASFRRLPTRRFHASGR